MSDEYLAIVAASVALLLAAVVWLAPAPERPWHPAIAPGVHATPFVGEH